MDGKRLVKISRYLSKHLRHQPQRLGLQPAPGGWVEIDRLLHACRKNNFPIHRQEGLHRMGRHHVHLSRDAETARKVGARHGKPVVLRVDAQGMARAGHLFFVSANDVWLAEHVPPEYLEAVDASRPLF